MRLLAIPVKIVRCVIPAQAGIHLAPFFAYALWIPACAGMTHLRTTRRLSNIPALQFKKYIEFLVVS